MTEFNRSHYRIAAIALFLVIFLGALTGSFIGFLLFHP